MKSWIVKSAPTAVGVCAMLIDVREPFECRALRSDLFAFRVREDLSENIVGADVILYVTFS